MFHLYKLPNTFSYIFSGAKWWETQEKHGSTVQVFPATVILQRAERCDHRNGRNLPKTNSANRNLGNKRYPHYPN